jgi:hypothetical protein
MKFFIFGDINIRIGGYRSARPNLPEYDFPIDQTSRCWVSRRLTQPTTQQLTNNTDVLGVALLDPTYQ